MENVMQTLYECIDVEKFKELTGYEFVKDTFYDDKGELRSATFSIVNEKEKFNFTYNKSSISFYHPEPFNFRALKTEEDLKWYLDLLKEIQQINSTFNENQEKIGTYRITSIVNDVTASVLISW